MELLVLLIYALVTSKRKYYTKEELDAMRSGAGGPRAIGWDRLRRLTRRK